MKPPTRPFGQTLRLLAQTGVITRHYKRRAVNDRIWFAIRALLVFCLFLLITCALMWFIC